MSVVKAGPCCRTWASWRRAGAARHRLYKHGLPDGGGARLVIGSIDMALLAEGGASRHRFYEYVSPD